MRLLSRVLFTFALLGGLAFGSYAFGKHVLSSKLFGNKGSKLNHNFGESTVSAPATRSASSKASGSAIASVEVLPESGDGGAPSRPDAVAIDPTKIPDRSNQASDDGAARAGAGIEQPLPDASSLSDAAPTRTRTRRTRTSDAAFDTPTPRPKKRRKRRKSRVIVAPQTNAAEAPARQDYSASPDAIVSDENTPREAPEEAAPRVEPRRESPSESSNNEAPSETPRRRRRTRVRTEEPSAPRTRIEPRRETPTRRDESPVPRPEGGDNGGGESPVPVPE